MHQPLPARPDWFGPLGSSGRLGAKAGAAAALAIFVFGFGTLLGAWYFQYVVGLAPCHLCLDERIPYYIIIPLSLLVALAVLARAPRWIVGAGFGVLAVAALAGVVLGGYHAGVEWRFWPGPTDCTAPLTNLSAGGPLLDRLRNVNVVRCDDAAWQFLGISLAGYNALISLAMAAIAGYGLLTGRKA